MSSPSSAEERARRLPFPLDAFETAVRADAEILGVLYTGSLGRGTTDPFSDLDIEVRVPDSVCENAPAKVAQILGYLGPVQFAYSRSDGETTALVGDTWQRVDLALRRQTDLRPGAKYAAAHVVKDTSGFLQQLVAASPAETITATPEQATALIAEAVDSQIYLALHNARGAVWSALGEISYRLAELYTLRARLRGRASHGFRFVESLLSPEEQALLAAAWPAAPTQNEVRRAARALWTWIRHVWTEAERIFGSPLDVVVDEAALLAAVDNIYARASEESAS